MVGGMNRPEPTSVSGSPPWTRVAPSSFALGNVAHHLVEVALGNHRAERVRRLERVAGAPFADLDEDLLEQLVLEVLVDDQAAVGGAVLAHVPEAGADDLFGDLVEVAGVGEDHRRVLAAAFEGDLLQIAIRGVLQEQAADLGRAGEGDGVDARVLADRAAAGLAAAGQDVEHAVGQAGLLRQFGEAQRGHARFPRPA